MQKEDRKIIENLIQQKSFSEIYKLYGQKTYLQVTPIFYQKKDVAQLLKEGRFFELYEKYGEDIYASYVKKIQKMDVQNELGLHHGFVNTLFFDKCKRKLKVFRNRLAAVSIASMSASFVLGGGLMMAGSNIVKENKIKYEREIDEYNNEIESYASYINSLNLNDLEIIVKVMNDMWSNIYGYQAPSNYDEIGYHRLALYQDGYGVCRNMADDFTARMNAINKDYEACNMVVYIDGAEMNNIETNIIQPDSTVENGEEPVIEDNSTSDKWQKFRGNHMVSCVRLKKENLLLIVDPTNPSIGILKNGKIHMLSEDIKDGINLIPIGNLFCGAESYKEYTEKIMQSYISSGNIDDAYVQYGIDAQNEVLQDIEENYDTDHYHVK